ncbi:MAG TPA: hypothetical protein VJ909_04400 [Prolixibacteraceae bacterium]|nr:hypothetical protein [Prolixibacteraceae bacterium]
MKTKVMYLATKITVAVVLVVLLAVEALAGEKPEVKVIPHSTDRAVVFVNNADDAYTELSIEDLNGSVIYYKEGRISDKLYSKLFDFTNLKDGKYKVVAKNNFGEKEIFFMVSDNTVNVVKEESSVKPFVKLEGNVLKVSYLNESLSDTYLTLYSENGEVFKKELGKDFSITAGFDIGKLAKGTYSANINNGSRTYSYQFNK